MDNHFSRAAQGLHAAADQLQLCDNLPPASNADVLAKLQTLVDGFARLERKVDTLQVKVDTLQGDVNDLKRSTTVINKNSEAKRWNQSATRPEDILAPMFRPNGELVNDCPGTVEELTGLNDMEVDRLLREMDVVVTGNAQWRRNQLKLAFGVTSILSRVWARSEA